MIFVYSLLFTSLVSFFAYALIPDDVRPQYFNNLISGISLSLVGPLPLKLCNCGRHLTIFISCSEEYLNSPGRPIASWRCRR